MYKVRREKNRRNRASNSRSFLLSGVHIVMFVVASKEESRSVRDGRRRVVMVEDKGGGPRGPAGGNKRKSRYKNIGYK